MQSFFAGQLLDHEPDLLRSMLTESGQMQNVYWICAPGLLLISPLIIIHHQGEYFILEGVGGVEY